MSLWVIFLTGLTVGGVGCIAVQGGLLASVIASREEADLEEGSRRKHTIWPTLSFLAAKLVVYLLLGFALGAFGKALEISDNVRTWMQLLAGFYMVAVALNLLNVHPVFRYVVIQPPKFFARLARNQSKSKDLFAPTFLGIMTIFIPCGTTIAMEALAISSGNPVTGAAILGAFVLGTSPLFFVLGYLTTALGDAFRSKFLKLAALLVIYLGLTSINGSLVAFGSPVTFRTLADNSPIQINLNGETTTEATVADNNVQLIDGVQNVAIKVFPNGYNPNLVRAKVGIPIKLNLTTTGGYGCTSSFVMPSLGIRRRLPRTGTDTIDLPAQNPGKITWTCSMGMYSGVLEVI